MAASFTFHEQSANYVIRGSGLAELDGKTNAELVRDYGFALSGAVTPADAVAIPGLSGGLAGSPVPSPADFLQPYLPTAAYLHDDGTFYLSLWDTIDQKYVNVPGVPVSDLKSGLNLIHLIRNGKVISGFAII